MPQIFGPQANWIARASVVVLPLSVIALLTAAGAVDRSGYVTEVDKFVEQPVPFSHLHHVGELGLDCRYCHTQVERGAHAGIPPASTCMTCHSQILAQTEMLRPVRESYARSEKIKWNKVTKLPDFVYFNHSIHIAKGVACASCHGKVEHMPLTRLEHPMLMSFCLDCHRDPARELRPRENVTDISYESRLTAEERRVLSEKVAETTHAESRMDCVTCHR